VPSVDISVDAEIPWNRLSLGYQHGQIPVPGLHRMFTECVQGAMEGLKLIGKSGRPGKINLGLFVGPGRERELEDEEWLLGWSFEGRRVSLPEARRLILLPAYVWMLQNKAYAELARLKMIGRMHAEDDNDLVIYDGVPSDDPDDFEKPLSAAAILVSYVNGQQEELARAPTLQ
jgi:hypothetical protein